MSGRREWRYQEGFSLIEVVVAAAVFSLGIGGMSLLLVLAVHGTYAPRSATLAALHAHALADALRLVPDGVVTGAADAEDCGPARACSPASMAASIMESWQAQLKRDLPTGGGLVCRDSTPDDPRCTESHGGAITVRWRDADPESGNEITHEFVLALTQP